MKLYNTRTRQVEPLEPIDPPRVSMYTCGPTVYNYAHIGNLRTYVFEDVLVRALSVAGYNVTRLMNITDVGHLTSDSDTGEDKMEKGARREGRTVWDVAEHYTEAFRQDMARLNLLEPDHWMKATDTIDDQVEMIRQLEQKGFTYRIDDGVYFDTSKVSDYGKLARLDLDGLQAGARIEMVKGKRRVTDFALWKFSPEGTHRQMEWDSPWGVGFPGWHTECCAMSMKLFGPRLDIHCGGIDHIPVHHTNEIAQAEAVSDVKPWVNVWLHGEFLVLPKTDDGTGGKMAKSGDNFLTLQVLVDKGYDPLAYRYFLLNAHYRAQLTFTFEALDSAQNAFRRLKNQVLQLKESGKVGLIDQPTIDRFHEAVFDDLAMPRAVAVMWETLRGELPEDDKWATLLAMDKVLGFGMAEMEPDEAEQIPAEILEKAERRQQARAEKNFEEADRLRDEITAAGYQVEDTPEGPKVSRS